MIREIIRPKTNQVVIHIPHDMINQELELLLFPIKRDVDAVSQKKKSKQLMKMVFENAKSITIKKNLNIDEIMDDMNDALS